ncbi:MAG: monooxygenase [Polyangiales bacterium]
MKLPLAFALAFLAGCSSSSSTNPGTTSDGGGADDASVSETGAPLGSYTVQFGPITVNPGIEKTQCVVKRLGNADKLHVGEFHNVLGDASHHLIVYRVNDTVEQTTPFDCKPFTDTLDPTKGSTLMITQKKDETLKLPTGVAYTLDANQMIRLEMHYINATKEAKTLVSTSTMIPIADSDYKDEADFLFIGNPDISLPPGKKTVVGPSFFKLPADYADAKFFAITGHEHQYGTNVTVNSVASKTDPGTPVYNVPGWNWAEPATVFQDPPFTVPAGGGFNFTCEYENTGMDTVSFGESANAEMCFFWAYYYPSHGAKVCVHTNKTGADLDFCCPGSPYCSFFGK